MSEQPKLEFKIATEDWEFELIHRLNYTTFVEEIPQHQPAASRRLVDKFHAQNTYLIALRGRELAGMAAIRGQRPFSLDEKLQDLDSFLPPHRSVCEIRLLAVEGSFRNGPVIHGLFTLLWEHGRKQNYDLAVMSGTTRQLRLYRRIGFVPFGPLVGTAAAPYQPMLLTLETFASKVDDLLRARPAMLMNRDG
jgi:ribosomal protein S18 acetylase RimI-like enzyme